MRELLKIIACGVAFAFAAADTLSASDPIDGTWDLDVAASRFDPGPGRRSDTRTYKVDGDNIRMTGTVVFPDGRTESIRFEAAFDGKDYRPIGNPRAETIAQVRVDAYTSKTTTDGKTLTITSTGTDEKGVTFNNILVFRKRVTSAQARAPVTSSPARLLLAGCFHDDPSR